jgi:serine/threonine-protein kinase
LGASANNGAQRLPSIEGYAIEAVLGRGGAGVVYRATHLRLQRPVALKMLLLGTFAEQVERARFEREARAIATLRHPHVVQIYEVGEHDGRPYFTMELMDGGSLAEKLGAVPLAPRDAAAIVETVARAVQAAHDAGIVHRDLKPGNVLLTADGTPKVSDFGLATKANHGDDDDGAGMLPLTQSGVRLGTPSYMAPEQALGGPPGTIGPAADVYGLGTILYEALTGRPPFRGASAAETQRQVIERDPAPPSRLNAAVPRDLETVCLKCLHKDPARRYASAAALADDLARFGRGEPILARPVGTVERVVKWVRRRPAAAALWAGGTLFVVGATAITLGWAADRTAIVRAVGDHLREARQLQREGRWVEANAALDRATERLGGRHTEGLDADLARARQDAALVPRLEAVRLTHVAHGMLADTRRWWSSAADRDYATVFREAAIGDDTDDPADVGRRALASPVRPALVAALYDWARFEKPARVHTWLAQVLRHADPDAPSWRDCALDPATWRNPKAISAFGEDVSRLSDADLRATPVELLLLIFHRLDEDRGPARAAALPFLTRVVKEHPRDYWANVRLSYAKADADDVVDAVRYAQAAVLLRPEIGNSHMALTRALFKADRLTEAIDEVRAALRIDPGFAEAHNRLGVYHNETGRYAEGLSENEAALRSVREDDPYGRSEAAQYHVNIAHSLTGLGRFGDADAHYRRAAALFAQEVARDPSDADLQKSLRTALMKAGEWDALLTAWRAYLAGPARQADRPCVGYPECCLFRGQVDEYRRGARVLLDQAAAADAPRDWERAARTSLLDPSPAPADLRRATEVIDRAMASEERKTWNAYFSAAKGLAEYRNGHYEAAIALIERNSAGVLPQLTPLPQLVVAMARTRLGQHAAARRTLAAAVTAFDWSPRNAADADRWMFHVLRREAEALILPDLAAFLDGRYDPQDADEGVAMTAACQFLERHAAHARLWAAAAATDPLVAGPGRARAVRAAALAGCGLGADAAALADADRAKWRAWALKQMQADLDAAAPAASRPARAATAATVAAWWTSPYLACVREPAALAALPAEERREWAAVWARAASLAPATQKQQR